MSDDFADQVKTFNEILKGAQNLLSIARDSDLQRETISKLSDFSLLLAHSKQVAIAAKNEDRANLILGMESYFEALQSELNMWLLLKAEKPEDAWARLIAAQTATSHAIRAHKSLEQLEGHASYLDVIEKVVFPGQVFLSAGLIVRKTECSICNADYEECSHLVGMPYWGQFCFRRLKDITPNHVAIVENPANKLCRVTHFSSEGGKRNRMTWRLEAIEASKQLVGDQKSLLTEGIIITKSDLVS